MTSHSALCTRQDSSRRSTASSHSLHRMPFAIDIFLMLMLVQEGMFPLCNVSMKQHEVNSSSRLLQRTSCLGARAAELEGRGLTSRARLQFCPAARTAQLAPPSGPHTTCHSLHRSLYHQVKNPVSSPAPHLPNIEWLADLRAHLNNLGSAVVSCANRRRCRERHFAVVQHRTAQASCINIATAH